MIKIRETLLNFRPRDLCVSEKLSTFVVPGEVGVRGVIGEISFSLIYYQNIIGNIDDDMPLDKEKIAKAKDSFRKLAAELRVGAYALLCYRIFYLLCLVPRRRNVLEAAPNLIRLSNTSRRTSPESVERSINETKSLLGIK